MKNLNDLFFNNDDDKFRDECLDFMNSYFPTLNEFYELTEEKVLQYLRESKYSGYPDEPGGSVWRSEGKFIYVMIRHLKPNRVLEIGNYMGRGSTNHILQAIDDNGSGEVVLLDIMERLEYEKLHSRKFTRVLNDSLEYLKQPMNFDFIVQDGCHEYDHVKKELHLISENNMSKFWLWSHDYFTVRPPECEIERAWKDSMHLFNKTKPLKDSISNCGFIIANKE